MQKMISISYVQIRFKEQYSFLQSFAQSTIKWVSNSTHEATGLRKKLVNQLSGIYSYNISFFKFYLCDTETE